MARRTWSPRARRDFREREEYRKSRGEKDRYEKRDDDREDDRRDEVEDSDERRRDAREDRMEERGFAENEYRLDADERENLLMQIRNASPDDDVDEYLDRLRREYDYYERELDRYDADYDDLMAQIDDLRRDNARYMMREGREIKKQQTDDIKEDGEPKTFDELFKEREG